MDNPYKQVLEDHKMSMGNFNSLDQISLILINREVKMQRKLENRAILELIHLLEELLTLLLVYQGLQE